MQEVAEAPQETDATDQPEGQTELTGEGLDVPRDEEIEGAADRYRQVRDERMELTEEEVECKDALLTLLHNKGLKEYKYRPKGQDDYFEIKLEPKETVTVRKAKAPKV